MKKKISLRMELVLLMLLSLFIAFTLALTLGQIHLQPKNQSSKQRIQKLYDECLLDLKADLLQCDLTNKEALNTLFQEKYGFIVGYDFYLIDQSGQVLASTNQNITQVASHLNGSSTSYTTPYYEVSSTDTNVYRVAGYEYIKPNYYLYYTYLRYDANDTGLVAFALIGAVLLFFFMIWGRISYISKLCKSVDEIAKGNLNERANCKYRNELRELAEGINRMASSLEQEEQKKNEFLTNISHDIRTPLTTILGYLDMLKHGDYDTEEEFQKYLYIMERKGNFLAAMLEDFFQYSKLVSKDITFSPIKLDINELLRQFQMDEIEHFTQHHLTLQVTLYQTALYCVADAELLARAVSDLLSNALKYAQSHTFVYMKSGVEKYNNKPYSYIEISNVMKEKISEKEMKLLFNRLYKCNDARTEAGSGLGLSIVKSIISLHHGILQVTQEGDRIIFRILLEI